MNLCVAEQRGGQATAGCTGQERAGAAAPAAGGAESPGAAGRCAGQGGGPEFEAAGWEEEHRADEKASDGPAGRESEHCQAAGAAHAG